MLNRKYTMRAGAREQGSIYPINKPRGSAQNTPGLFRGWGPTVFGHNQESGLYPKPTAKAEKRLNLYHIHGNCTTSHHFAVGIVRQNDIKPVSTPDFGLILGIKTHE